MTNKNLARVLVLTPHDIDASESPSVTMPFRLFGIDIVTDLDDEGTENEGDIEFTSYAADKSLVVKAENENGEAAENPSALDLIPVLLQWSEMIFGEVNFATIAREDEVNLEGITPESMEHRNHAMKMVQSSVNLISESEEARKSMTDGDQSGWVSDILDTPVDQLHDTLLIIQTPISVSDDYDVNENVTHLLEKVVEPFEAKAGAKSAGDEN